MTIRDKTILAFLPSCAGLGLILAWGIYDTFFYEVPAGQVDYRMSSGLYIAAVAISILSLLMLPSWLAYRKLPEAKTPQRHNLWLFVGEAVPLIGFVIATVCIVVEQSRRHVEWEGFVGSLVLILPVVLPLCWVRQGRGKERWASEEEFSDWRRVLGYYFRPGSAWLRYFYGLLGTMGLLLLIGLSITVVRYREKEARKVWIPFECGLMIEEEERSWVAWSVDRGGEAVVLRGCLSWEMSLDGRELEPGWTWQRVGQTFAQFRDNPPDLVLDRLDADDLQQLLPYFRDVRSVRLGHCPKLNASQEEQWEDRIRAAGGCVLQGRGRH